MKMQNVYANAKLASIPLTLLLVVAGLFGFVLLMPLNAAHAAGPTITVSPTTATVHTGITIAGTGFSTDSAVQITTAVAASGSTGSVTVPWLSQGGCGTTNGGTSGTDSLVDAAGTYANCLVTDATGSFVVTVSLPPLPGGPETISVQDSASPAHTATASITVTPSMLLCTVNSDSANFVKCTNNSVTDHVFGSGYPETSTGTFFELINGFGQADSITLSSSVYPSSGFTAPTCTTNNVGQCQITDGFIVADAVGGTHSIIATGGSGLTASAPFVILPWVNFYNGPTGATTYSFSGNAPTSILIEGHGFASSTTIAANSITIGGVTTTHSSIKTDSHGAFGAGANNQLVVSPVAGVPFGPVSVVVEGTTFNYANHNINQGANGADNIRPSPGHNAPRLGGVLISSVPNAGLSGTGVGLLDATTHYQGDGVGIFGYGFVNPNVNPTSGVACAAANAGGAVTPSLTNLPGITAIAGRGGTIQNTVPDCNGAVFYDLDTGGLYGPEAQGSYQVTFSQAGNHPSNIVSPSYTAAATLWLNQFDTGLSTGIIYTPPSPATGGTTQGWCDNAPYLNPACEETNMPNVIQAEFFAASSTVTVSVGGNTLATCSTNANGECLTNTITNSALDLAAGTWTATASDGTNSATDTFVVDSIITGPGFGGSALTTHGPAKAGTFTTLLTTAAYGVHGLMPNTVYNVNWGLLGATGTQTVGTFTSTATGGIPVPGVQIQIPAGTVGDHVITLVQAGSDYLLANSFGEEFSAAGPLTIYGDTVFQEQVNVNVLPSVANVGGSITLSGTGLEASTSYEVTIDNTLGPQNGQILGSFTTDASGNIPASIAVVFPADAATAAGCGTINTYPEQASTYYVHTQTASQYGTPGSDGNGIIVLAADAKVNMTSAPAGHAVVLTANGLCSPGTYNVVFNYAENSQANGYTGTVIGAFTTDSSGSGTVTVTIPSSASAGAYPLQLVRLAPTSTQLGVLSVPPTLTVSTVGTSSCQSTSCLTATGPATQTTISGQPALAVTFTNSANAQVTGIVYAVVHNAAGQTVYYTTATITPAAGGTATAYLVLAGLPSGTYSVSYFAINSAGVAISASGTSSVTF